jgi:DNA repair protein RadD
MLVPRPYQTECLETLDWHIRTKDTNPCAVIPTGGGKSALIAWTIQQWKEQAEWFRCIILAHRKELIEQNANELNTICPGLDVGIFSAALKRRDWNASILYASIDSVYKKAGEFLPWDTIMVDEAHRIPFRGEGKYRTFINESRRYNPNLRTIGWTATPFRMAGGQICHRDHILNEICYEAKVIDLIKDGYLCQLRSKVGVTQPELKEVKRNSGGGGDYVLKSLAEATNREKIVFSAVQEAVGIINAEDRHSVIFFCVNIEHCKKVSAELRRHGIHAPFVTSKTRQCDRDRIVADFKAGRLRAICNVNVYTEGFNVQHVDCIVLLRPTLSAGLYSQMVGRGLRICSSGDTSISKDNCLVLDFAGCIEEHGPIDLLGGERTVMAVCGRCRESFSRAVRACPSCGWEIPKQEIERLEQKEKERRLHGKKASDRSILSTQPETHKVDAVYVNRHRKDGSPDSLRVQYRCGLSMFREWVCLDHPEYAGQKGYQWYERRFGRPKQKPTVDSTLENLFLSQEIHEWTKTITVRKNGKYWEVVDYNQPLVEEVAA